MAIDLLFHIDEYLRHLSYEKRYSAHTVAAYERDLKEFVTYLQAHTSDITHWQQVNTQMIRSWIAHVAQHKAAPSTLKRKKSSLQSLYKYLLRQQCVTHNPAALIPTPKLQRRLPKALDARGVEQMMSVQSTVLNHEDWDYANALLITSLLFETGMRRMELCNLQLSDIDFHRQTVLVFGKGGKERLIPLHPETCTHIQLYHSWKINKCSNLDHNYLLVTKAGAPVYPQYVYRLVRKFLSQVTSLDQKSPHVLRHTFATALLNNGAEINAIKDLLGHSSLAATQIYTHTDIESLKKEFKKAHPRS